MSKEEFLFCPLGGSGEIGMNLNLYAFGKEDSHKWIAVDMGVTFADDSIPGIDLIYPDPGFLIEKKKELLGIILTHAHEDHIGSVALIWPELKCRIYATPFTAALIKEKFREKKIDITHYLQIVQLNGKIKLEGVQLKNNEPHTYKLTFYGNIVNLKDTLGEDKLSNLTQLHYLDFQYNLIQYYFEHYH